MKRKASQYLQKWLGKPGRKPLVMRGARQVGKTWLVRELARESGRRLVELNFERRPELAAHFESNDPKVVLNTLSAEFGQTIDVNTALLFLDEIQAAPELLPKLRWFYEEIPELPVVAAGSLLEFVLGDHDFSMPVGRISYMHVEPMSFMEFLGAVGEELLRGQLDGGTVPQPLHEKAGRLFREYCLVGGMPEVVADWAVFRSHESRREKQISLLATFRDDFNKYRNRVPDDVLRAVFGSVPAQLGERFMFSHVDREMRQPTVKKAFSLLTKARVCHRVSAVSHVGVPLSGDGEDGLFKAVFMDTGLALASLGIGAADWLGGEADLWNKGPVAEQVVGQLLRCRFEPFEEPSLHYWTTTSGGNAEIDYLVQHGSRVVPVEVKAGAAGAMKSLHHFMAKYRLEEAVRFDANPPSAQQVHVRTTTGDDADYTLRSFPLYMAERVFRS